MSEASSLLVAQDRESSEQRKEAVFLGEKLAAVAMEQDRLDRERTAAENIITEEKRTSSSSSQEDTRMKMKEVILAECLVQQEQKLQGDLVSGELVLTSLKEEALAYKKRLGEKEQELARLRQEVQENQGFKEKSEELLQQTRQEMNQLIDQMTHLSLARDALEGKAGHLKEEVAKLRGEQEAAQLHVANITQGIDELVSRLATRELEVTDMRVRVGFLEGEVERLGGVAEDWRLKADCDNGKVRELQEALALGQGELERLDGHVLTLKNRLLESTKKMSEQHEQARSESTLSKARILELSLIADNLRKELVVEKREAGERLGREMSTSSELRTEVAKLRNRLEEVGKLQTSRDSLALEVAGLKEEKERTLLQELNEQPQVSTSTSPSTWRASTPPSTSSTDTLYPSLKRSVDLKADSNYQKKVCVNTSTEGIYVQVSSSVTQQGRSSVDMEIDLSMEVEGGEERGQVDSSNLYFGDVEVEEGALGSEQEENSLESLATRAEEGAEAGSPPLQTLEHMCDGCQSVFTRAASLRHHQAVAGRCKRVKEPKPPEFACPRCSRQFTSKSPWNRHVFLVLDCAVIKKQRGDKVVEEVDSLEVDSLEVDSLEVQEPNEAHADVDSLLEVLTAESPQPLAGLSLEVKEVLVGRPEEEHCYARSSSLAPEHRPSSHNPAQPAQVNSGLYLAQVLNGCQVAKTKILGIVQQLYIVQSTLR